MKYKRNRKIGKNKIKELRYKLERENVLLLKVFVYIYKKYIVMNI